MTKLKPILWMLSGVVLGCSATALALPEQKVVGPVFSMPMPPSPSQPMRMTSVFAGHVRAGDVYFVKDTKSSGCWISTVNGEQSAVAVAPKEACE